MKLNFNYLIASVCVFALVWFAFNLGSSNCCGNSNYINVVWPKEIQDLKTCLNFISNQTHFPAQDWKLWSTKAANLRNKEFFGTKTHNIDAFAEVYNSEKWGKGSGPGSDLNQMQVKLTICHLANFLVFNSVDVLIDTSCGDQQWMPYLRKILPNLKYIGIDVTPAVIQYNRETFGVEGKVEFFLLDITEPDYFQKINDHSKIFSTAKNSFALSRHTLYHLTDEDIKLALRNFKKSTVNWIGITNHPNHPENKREHMKSGEFAFLNLMINPWLMRSPFHSFKEDEMGEGELAIWRKIDFSSRAAYI